MIKSPLTSTSSLMIPPYQLPPNYNVAPIKDLITFEERLRQNLDNIHRMRFKWHYSHWYWFIIIVYALLVGLAITAFTTWRTWSASSASHYRQQCQKSLHIYNLQLIKDEQHGGQCLSFLRRVPRQLQEFVDEYRAEFRARRALRPMQPPTAAARKTTILKLE